MYKKLFTILSLILFALTSVASAATDIYLKSSNGNPDYRFSYDANSVIQFLTTRIYCGTVYVFSSSVCYESAAKTPTSTTNISNTTTDPSQLAQQNTYTGTGSVANSFTLPSETTSTATINASIAQGATSPQQQTVYQVIEKIIERAVPGPKGDKGDKGDPGAAGSTVVSGQSGQSVAGSGYYNSYVAGGQYNGPTSPNATYSTVNTGSLTSGSVQTNSLNTSSINTGNLTASGTSNLSTTSISGTFSLGNVASGSAASPILVHGPNGEVQQISPADLLASSTSNVIAYTGGASNTLTSMVNGSVSTTTIGTLNNLNLTGTTTSQNIVNSGNIVTNFLSSVLASITNLLFGNATGTNITATGTASLATVVATNTTSTNIQGTNATLTNATSTNLFATNASLTNATISNLTVDSISVPNTLSSSANTLTSNVGGSISTTSIVNLNAVDFATTTKVLTSTVNGVAATTSLANTFADLICTITGTYFCDGGNARGANLTLGTNDSFAQTFETNNTERMRIAANGNVGINNTAPAYTLDVNGMLNQTVTLSDARTTSVHSGANVIGAGIKGVGFTSQDATTSDLSYLFAGDARATGGYENQATVGINNFSTGLNTQYLAGINAGNYFSAIQSSNTNYWNNTQWDQNGIKSSVNNNTTFAETILTPGQYQVNNADVIVSKYSNTRDDSGTTSPINFLYTDNVGKVLSAPTSYLFGSLPVNNGLTNNGGTIQLGGTLIQDTKVDGQGYTISFNNNKLAQILGQYVEIGSTGNNSFNGNSQVAIGNSNILDGDSVIAIGEGNNVLSPYSYAFGRNNSFATGVNGDNMSFGQNNTNNGGQYTYLLGHDNISSPGTANEYIIGYNNSSFNAQSKDNYIIGESNNLSSFTGSHFISLGSYFANGGGSGNMDRVMSVGFNNTVYNSVNDSGMFGVQNTIDNASFAYTLGTGLINDASYTVDIGTTNNTKATIDQVGRLTLRGPLNVNSSDGNTGDMLISQGTGAVSLWVKPSTILASSTTNIITYASTTNLLTSAVNGVLATTSMAGLLRADNGLSVGTDGMVELGGSLHKNTFVNNETYNLQFTNTNGGQWKYRAIAPTVNSSSVGGALNFTQTASGTGIGALFYTDMINPTIPASGTTAGGPLMYLKTSNDLYQQHALFVDYSGVNRAANIYMRTNATGDGSMRNASALNVTSNNYEESSVSIRGREADRGTVKITHQNWQTNAGFDANAAALSIDLVSLAGGAAENTSAKGIFINSSTQNGTSGNLLEMRNSQAGQTNSLSLFKINSNGGTYITPSASGSVALAISEQGMSNNALQVLNNGKMTWGSGTSTGDVSLYRPVANILAIDSVVTNQSGLRFTNLTSSYSTTSTSTQFLTVNGSGDVVLSSISSSPNLSTLAVGTTTLPTGKIATFAGDIDVTGTIDPTRILFSNLAGVNSPSYNPSANGNNYSIRFEEGGGLNFQSASTTNILQLNNDGRVAVGSATPTYKFNVVSEQADFTGGTYGMTNQLSANTNFGSRLAFYKSRGTSAAPTAVLAGDVIGTMQNFGYDSTGFFNAGAVNWDAAEAWSATGHGTQFRLTTVANGSTALSERLRITNQGNSGFGGKIVAGLTSTTMSASDNAALTEINALGTGSGTTAPAVSIIRDVNTGASSLPGTILGQLKFVSKGSAGAMSSTTAITGASIDFLNQGNAWNTNTPTTGLAFNILNSSTTTTEAMRINGNGNVGIGTNAPGNALTVSSSTSNVSGLRLGINANTITLATSSAFLTVNTNGDVVLASSSVSASSLAGFVNGQVVFGNASGSLSQSSGLFWDNASNTLTITSAGSIGVGLKVNGIIQGGNGGSPLVLQDGAGNQVFRGLRATAWSDATSTQWFQIGQSNDNVAFTSAGGSVMNRTLMSSKSFQISATGNYISPTSNLFSVVNGSSLFDITTGGNVGIGTTTPGNALVIASSSASISGLRLAINSSTTAATGTGTFLAVNANGDVYQADTQNMSFTNLLVGTTTATAGKVATFQGDIKVTGTIDPTRILFSGLNNSGTLSPTYTPSANGNNYSVRFEEGGGLNFQSASTTNILQLNNDGNVGIGTATPTSRLAVSGGAITLDSGLTSASLRPGVSNLLGNYEIRGLGSSPTSDNGFLRLSAGGGTNGTNQSSIDISGFSTNADMNNSIVFKTSGINRVRLFSNGYMAMNNATASRRLSIYGVGNGDSAIALFDTMQGTDAKSFVIDNRNQIFSIGPDSDAGGTYAGSLFITRNNNVGIGTSSPIQLLQVHQPLAATGNLVQITSAVTGSNLSDGLQIGITSTGQGLIRNQENTPLIFGTNAVEVARFTAGGFLGLGTTTPASRLSVAGSASIGTNYAGLIAPTNGLLVEGNVGIGVANPTNALQVATGSISLGGGNMIINGNDTSSVVSSDNGNYYDRFVITAGGANTMCFNITNGLFGACTSDIRWKGDVNYLSGGTYTGEVVQVNGSTILDKIQALKPATFKWRLPDANNNPTDTLGNTTDVGFIAQDVAQVFPEATKIGRDGYYNFSPSNLVPYIVKGMQELTTKVESATTSELTIKSIQYMVTSTSTAGLVPVDATSTENQTVLTATDGSKQFADDFTHVVRIAIEKLSGYYLNMKLWVNEITTNKIFTNEICIKKSDGNYNCLNGDSVQNGSIVVPTATPASTPTITATATDTTVSSTTPTTAGTTTVGTTSPATTTDQSTIATDTSTTTVDMVAPAPVTTGTPAQ